MKWELSRYDGSIMIDDANGEACIARIINGTERDAKLMRAAPDMLAVLEAIRNDCSAWLEGEMDSLSQGDLCQAFINAAQGAINETEDAT